MTDILNGIPGVVCLLDDVLVMGVHRRNMITSSLATRQSRCKKKSVKYLRPSVLILIDVMHDVEGTMPSMEGGRVGSR